MAAAALADSPAGTKGRRAFEGWQRDSTAAVDLARYDQIGPRAQSRRQLKGSSRKLSQHVDSGASMADATGLLIAPPGSTQLHAGDQLCVITASAHEKLTAGGKARILKGGKRRDDPGIAQSTPPSPW